MKAAFLPDRGVVKITGETARDFLNNLITTDTTRLQPGLGRFGALLTPQGKIMVDFLITEAPAGHGGGFLIDCPKVLAQTLADKLGFYRLRAKVGIENLSDSLGVLAAWDGDAALKPDLTFTDPRNASLGLRILVPAELAPKAASLIGAEMVDSSAYEAHRIAAPRARAPYACCWTALHRKRDQPSLPATSQSAPWARPPIIMAWH
jgi:folate-binding Fe-S cluster repair protein YgfZ